MLFWLWSYFLAPRRYKEGGLKIKQKLLVHTLYHLFIVFWYFLVFVCVSNLVCLQGGWGSKGRGWRVRFFYNLFFYSVPICLIGRQHVPLLSFFRTQGRWHKKGFMINIYIQDFFTKVLPLLGYNKTWFVLNVCTMSFEFSYRIADIWATARFIKLYRCTVYKCSGSR